MNISPYYDAGLFSNNFLPTDLGDYGIHPALLYNNVSFKLAIISIVAAFEHFLDIPAVIDECFRILRKGGILWAMIHLFSSLSGGHNVKLMEIPLRIIPRGIEPWDHLRKRHLPFHVPLNEWRVHQFLEEISGHFVIQNHYCAIKEGEHLLTPNIEAELSNYSEDELTCRTYVIVAQKR